MKPLAEDLQRYGNKADRVYDALRDEFVRGEWPFGQTFSAYELAERFGVSRRPIMDAVQRLEADGFVDIIPQVGCRVVLPEETRIRDNLELSAAVEGPAARMAAERATRADIEQLERIYAREALIVEARDGDAYAQINWQFHAAILDIAGNRALASVAAGAWELREFYFHPYRNRDVLDILEDRHVDHGRIVEAIRRRDGEAARARMEQHLDPAHGLDVIRGLRAKTEKRAW